MGPVPGPNSFLGREEKQIRTQPVTPGHWALAGLHLLPFALGRVSKGQSCWWWPALARLCPGTESSPGIADLHLGPSCLWYLCGSEKRELAAGSGTREGTHWTGGCQVARVAWSP